MTNGEFQKVLDQGDAGRISLTAGNLLQGDPGEERLKGRLNYLKGILAGYPKVVGTTRQEFFDWMRVRSNQEILAKTFIQAVGLAPAELEKVIRDFGRAMERWDDPGWEQQAGRHEYHFTLSACDLASLPDDFRNRFPALQRLCLWSFGRLRELPALPNELKTLDLRHARALERIADLPSGLETLDLTGCSGLQRLPRRALPGLKRLYLSRCGSLTAEEFLAFWEAAGCASNIEELELHHNGWLKSFKPKVDLPALRVLRLSDCKDLSGLPDWSGWAKLEHLDLRQCEKVAHLPELPERRLGYLGLHGCDLLREYQVQDLNERDLGVGMGENVADLFYLRTRLGERTVQRPRCKLLFLGNGRAGKTTLAKALLWIEMDDAAKAARPDLEPSDKEDVSHAIQQLNWRTGLPVSSDPRRKPISEASIRLWDFGGQETYHGTHRVFAASGALYIVALRDRLAEPTDPNPDERTRIPDLEWKQYNRQRPVEYWLDYILDLDRAHGSRTSARARVLLVHCGCLAPAEDLRVLNRLSEEQRLSEEHRKMVAGEWFVGSLENEWACSGFKGTFREALKKALHGQVVEEGIRTPKLFAEVLDRMDAMVREIHSVSHPNAMLSWKKWHCLLLEAAEGCHVKDWTEADSEVLTRLFHRSGDLFWMRAHERLVILHQKSALEEIYRLLNFREVELAGLRRKIRETYGLFDARDLREGCWRNLSSRLQDQLLEFMQSCQICARVFSRGTDGVPGEPMVALDPTLLPMSEGRIEEELRAEFVKLPNALNLSIEKIERDRAWKLKPEAGKPRRFSESAFRALQAWAVGKLNNQVRLWVNGLQFSSGNTDDPAGFKLRWQGRDGNADAYDGTLAIHYWKRPEEGASPRSLQFLKDALMGAGSPFPFEEWLTHEEIESSGDVQLDDGRHDVAISVRGFQADAAGRLKAALKGRKLNGRELKVFFYKNEEERHTITSYYEAIRQARVQVLWVSDEYLSTEFDNRYSLHECASAMFAWAKSRDLAVDAVHLEDLPKGRDQDVAMVYEPRSSSFDFRADLKSRLHRALMAMAKEYEARKSDPSNTIKEAKYHEKFKAAAALSGPFAEFVCDQISKPNSPFIVMPAPADDEARASLADRLEGLLRQ